MGGNQDGSDKPHPFTTASSQTQPVVTPLSVREQRRIEQEKMAKMLAEIKASNAKREELLAKQRDNLKCSREIAKLKKKGLKICTRCKTEKISVNSVDNLCGPCIGAIDVATRSIKANILLDENNGFVSGHKASY